MRGTIVLYMLTIGIDEVGRGCWAGSLVAGAVLLDNPISGLADSKILTAPRREQLDTIIRQDALAYGIGWVTAAEIDCYGLSKSVAVAMQRAYEELISCVPKLDMKLDVIIDGNINYLQHLEGSRCLIKADASVPAASAASIIAKVARDTYMKQIAEIYPGYGFEKHVGYGTQMHRAAIQAKGITDIHRRSFRPIKDYLR